MKTLIYFFVLASVLSCGSGEDKSTNISEEPAMPKPVIQAEKSVERQEALDPESFEYFLTLTDHILEEIPRYHIDKFIGTRWDNEQDPYRKIYSEGTDHYKLHNNYVVTFRVSIYGVQSETILATFTSKGDMIHHLIVAETSDMDLSSTSSSSRSFEFFADSLVRIHDSSIKAKNYEYTMPDSIDLFDLDSTEVIESSKYKHYRIRKSGRISKVVPQETILIEADLRALTKTELRIKRNEYFARLGYIFQSDDLKEHFEKTDWYVPQFIDVTHKLTGFDIYNINLIKRIEMEK